jgi:Family of unknown function (DUF6508)
VGDPVLYPSWDRRIDTIARHAAAILQPLPGKCFVEDDIRRALEPAFAATGHHLEKEKSFPLVWRPQPRGFDGAVLDRFGLPHIALEYKQTGKVSEVLWDIFKLASVHAYDGLDAGYCVVAGPSLPWTKAGDCRDLFRSYRSQVSRPDLLVARYPKAWANLLEGGPARPEHLPRRIETELISAFPTALIPGFELRVIAVRCPGFGEWVEFEDGYPRSAGPEAEPVQPDRTAAAIGPSEIERLTAFIPALAAPAFTAGRWMPLEQPETGPKTMPWFHLNETGSAFLSAFYEDGWWLKDFDWATWRRAAEFEVSKGYLAEAPLLWIRRLLTFIVRLDRFNEGSFGSCLKDGRILEILRRLERLGNEMRAVDSRPSPS